jgi:Holliday junction DNA helicase RuvA
MIGWLNGTIVDKSEVGKFVIETHGVGYDVETSLHTFFKLEHQVERIGLHIHTIVREDALLLYGFFDKAERALFRALIKVNGIGPKSAIAILSSVTPDEFIATIRQKDTALLTKLPGIGKKTAERLVVEMQDNIQKLPQLSPELPTTRLQQEEAISALEALGYKRQDATKTINKIDDGNQTCEQLIRIALQHLSQRSGVI